MNRDFRLLPAGSRVLCAVSGGADSVCLLHWLRGQEDLQLFAAHFEHGLRGEESLRDAAFVEKLCGEWEIPLSLEHGDAAAYAKENGLGIEEAARALRYAFLERAADELSCDRIATAHNADDNAETVLLNLCRGAGAAGLCGIPPMRGRIVRPLLNTPRREIEDYLRANGLPHVEDSSNENEIYRRNLLRRRVTPVLRELNPRFDQAVLRTSFLLREDASCLDAQAEDFLRTRFSDGSLPLSELLALPFALSSRVLRRLSPRSLELEHVEAALAFCAGTGYGVLDLPGLRLRREQGRLYLSEDEPVTIPERPLHPGETVSVPEAGLLLHVDTLTYQGEIYDLFKTYLFKCENIYGTLNCTGRRPGDRIHPQGRNCGKSLHDLFRDAGLTRRERDTRPVLRDDKGVLAVLGYPADRRACPKPGDLVLRVQIEYTGGHDGESD